MYGTNDIEKVKKLIKSDIKEPFDFEKQYVVLTGIGEKGFLKETGNWFASGFDLFNSLLGLPFETPKFKGYGSIPVNIEKKENIDTFECSEFITKA